MSLKPNPGRIEFIVLLALMSALDAFAIDAMLPALGEMGKDLNLANDNQRQLIITSIFFGFSFGVLAYGFISDRYGRRAPVIAGFLVFIVATGICTYSHDLKTLLAGRVLQGVGAAGPYVLAVAIVRDRYDGRDMAQIMSLIMMVFIGVPMVAPFIGQYLQLIAGWRSIFVALAVYAVIVLVWFYIRQPETLKPENRKPLTWTSVSRATRQILSDRQALSYLLVLGVISGAFIAYLSTAQQVFHDMYGLGEKLPLTIACLATTYGIACFTNAKLVQALGMRKLVGFALMLVICSSAVYALVILVLGHNPSLPYHLIYMAMVIFSFGFLFENVVTLALETMGDLAGAAMSVITALSTLMAVVISYLVGALLNTTVLPLAVAFCFMCVCGYIIHRWALNAPGFK